MQTEELLTPADVARELGVTPHSVRVWESLGRIRAAVKTPRGNRLFTRQEVARVAAERRTMETRGARR